MRSGKVDGEIKILASAVIFWEYLYIEMDSVTDIAVNGSDEHFWKIKGRTREDKGDRLMSFLLSVASGERVIDP